MAILKRKSSRADEEEKKGMRKFIDLNDYRFQDEKVESMATVRVAEVRRLEDLRIISQHIYDGDLLIIDCTQVSSEEYTMKRVTEEIKRLVKDVNGDVAGISKSFLVVSPPGITIDRTRIRGY